MIRNFFVEYDYGDIGSKLMIVSVPNKPLRFRFIDRSAV
uniref:Uncharacterized protein n=1 Tax=Bracon brevicornis TaxID=1563983 RepID=A0A6V7M065_9HYME